MAALGRRSGSATAKPACSDLPKRICSPSPKNKRLVMRTLVRLAVAFGLASTAATAQNAAQIAMHSDDIAGVVRSAAGPEAGVWVIAETKDLPTRFARIVV